MRVAFTLLLFSIDIRSVEYDLYRHLSPTIIMKVIV